MRITAIDCTIWTASGATWWSCFDWSVRLVCIGYGLNMSWESPMTLYQPHSVAVRRFNTCLTPAPRLFLYTGYNALSRGTTLCLSVLGLARSSSGRGLCATHRLLQEQSLSVLLLLTQRLDLDCTVILASTRDTEYELHLSGTLSHDWHA